MFKQERLSFKTNQYDFTHLKQAIYGINSQFNNQVQ